MKKFKIGDKVKIKLKPESFDNDPGFDSCMKKYFGQTVTISSYGGLDWFKIKEDNGEWIWDRRWVEVDKSIIDKPIIDKKVILQDTIKMWEYMVNTHCNKKTALLKLFDKEGIYNNCLLCEDLLEDDGTSNCIKCLNWSKKNGRYPYRNICLMGDSPYRRYHNGDISSEKKKEIVYFLKKEYVRLYGLAKFKKNNPKLYRFLLKSDVLDLFMETVILQKSGEMFFNKFNLKDESLSNYFVWESTEQKHNYWSNLNQDYYHYITGDKKQQVKIDGEYSFKDGDIDFCKLCLDALEDGKVGFIVSGEDIAYVGLLHTGKSVGVPIVYEDFMKSGNILNHVSDLPYGIFEISLDRIDSWREKLEEYSKNYKEWATNLKEVKKDTPKEELKTYKVIQF